MDLFPYQTDGVAFLRAKSRALLADEPGLGKTAQAIRAAAESGARTILVVCPASVKDNWRREIRRFAPEHQAMWQVESYDGARARAGRLTGLDTVILDEAHFCKSKDSKRTKALLGPKCDGVGGVIEGAERVYALSGTPSPNNSSELWPMLRALFPQAIIGKNDRPMSYWSFVDRYCRTLDNGFGIQIVGNKNSAELKQRIGDFVLRRRKEDVAKDLPPISFDTLPLSHKEAAKALAEAEASEDTEEIRKALKDGADGLSKLSAHVATLRRLTGVAKTPAVVEWIKDWLDAGGEKLVVFAYHKEVLRKLQGAFAAISVCVSGETPSADRQRAVDLFQMNNNVKLFIGQITAAGTGITLTAASDVLFAESSWVPSDNQQAAMRVHRIGQKNACLVRFATLSGSLDEQIQAAVARKTAEISQIFA